MGSTYYSLHYHWVCSTKNRRPLIREAWESKFHQYIGGTIRGLDGVPLKIGGVADHIHALLGLKPIHCPADFSRELKKATTRWASDHEHSFGWQEGYAIFSVSVSGLKAVENYIARQREHHRRMTFTDELKKLLEKHGIKYDAKYLE